MLFVEESHNEPRNINVIKEVFSTVKKLISNIVNIENSFRSEMPTKDYSRKKLQLTIKSFSQKDLLMLNKPDSPKCVKAGGNSETSISNLERREISCLFEKRKKIKNAVSQDVLL